MRHAPRCNAFFHLVNVIRKKPRDLPDTFLKRFSRIERNNEYWDNQYCNENSRYIIKVASLPYPFLHSSYRTGYYTGDYTAAAAEFLMRTVLFHLSIINDKNLISIEYCRQTMSNNEGSATHPATPRLPGQASRSPYPAPTLLHQGSGYAGSSK